MLKNDAEFVEALLHSKVLKERMLQEALFCRIPDEPNSHSIFGHACAYNSGCGMAGELPSTISFWARPCRALYLDASRIKRILWGDLGGDPANAPLLLATLSDRFEQFGNDDPEGLLHFLTQRTLAMLLLENSFDALKGRCLTSAMQEAYLP